MSPLLRVLRISHSSVVPDWRRREAELGLLGVPVSLVTARRWSEGGGPVELTPQPGEEVVGVQTWGSHPCGFAYNPWQLGRAMRSHPHDVLDVHEEPYSVAAAEVATLRWLLRDHTPMVFYTAQNLAKRHPLPIRMAEKMVLAVSAGAYACNRAAAANLRKRGFRGVVKVIPLGVDGRSRHTPAVPSRGCDARSSPGQNATSGLVIGCAGRLTREKGFHLVLEALADEPDWSLKLVGDGPERPSLLRLAEELGVARRVEMLGYRAAAAMADFYSDVNVVVVPSVPTESWEEQFGRVVVEAMAAGAPVVSSDSGALPEVVGEAGFLFPAGDAHGLHEVLAKLEAVPEERAELSRKGRARAEAFGWDEVARQQLSLYRDVASPGTARPGLCPSLPGMAVLVVAYGQAAKLARSLAALTSRAAVTGGAALAHEAEGGLPKVWPGGVEVVVVDNSSDKEVRDVTVGHGARYIDSGANLGFARAVNLGLKHLGAGRDVLLLNPDAEVGLATVARLQARMHSAGRVACAAPAQHGPDGRPQRVTWPFPSPLGAWLQAVGAGAVRRDNGFLIGSVLLLHNEALAELGGLDERFFLYAEESDWQLRARRAGWGVLYCPELAALHEGAGTSSDTERRELLFAAGQERYMRKWYGQGGWAIARGAVVAGALARAVCLPGQRRVEAWRRARQYAMGPVRLAGQRGWER